MIIGNGDIASALTKLTLDSKYKQFVFFASGVSNSQETNALEYEREKQLLLSQPQDKHLVYFSSLSIYYSDTPYTRHKLAMEALIKKHFKKYTIVRLGNITWGKNPHTLINHFRNSAARGEPLKILDTYRYLVTKNEFLYWIGMIPDWSCEMNITGRRLKVEKIVEQYVNKHKKTPLTKNRT